MLVIFWIPGVIGAIVTMVLSLITSIRINKFCNNLQEGEKFYLNQLDIKTQLLLCAHAVIFITMVAGIMVGQFSGMFYKETFLARMVLSIGPTIILYLWIGKIIEIDSCDDKRIKNLLVIIFLLSIAIWTTLIANYYRENVEETTQKVIEEVEKRELLYFCDIPLTDKTAKTSNTKNLLGSEIPYKYVDAHNLLKEDTAITNYSSSKPTKYMESPYLEIISYYSYREYRDYYTELCWYTNEHRWREYVFHLPNNISITTE